MLAPLIVICRGFSKKCTIFYIWKHNYFRHTIADTS